MSTADVAWRAVKARYAATRNVTVMTKFGTESLRVSGTVFAMHYKGTLVVKLPPVRVAELLNDRTGTPFVLGSRTMKAWVSIPVAHGRGWPAIAEESRAFVSRR